MSEAIDDFEFWRIATDERGTTTMERIDVTLTPGPTGSLHSQLFDLFCGSPESVRVAFHPAGHVNPWHTANKRQLYVTLAGERELETGDGQVLVTRPGVVVLVEDLDGTGHHMRARGQRGSVALFIPLSEPTVPATETA